MSHATNLLLKFFVPESVSQWYACSNMDKHKVVRRMWPLADLVTTATALVKDDKEGSSKAGLAE